MPEQDIENYGINPSLLARKQGGKLRSHFVQRVKEAGILSILSVATLFSVVITIVIVVVLGFESSMFLARPEVTPGEFFLGTEWNPLLGREKHFGIWPLVSGTFLVAGIALVVAIPLGLLTAIYLSEYAPQRVRVIVKPAIEVLAGIPTVVYGFFALVLLTPMLGTVYDNFRGVWNPLGEMLGYNLFGMAELFILDKRLGGYNALSAGIAVGILILPIVSSLSEDALQAVPRALRDGAYGLGGTRFDSSVKVVFPAALSGIVSAVLLAGARAVGETMIVAMAAGSTPKLTIDPREGIQTMTGFMVQMALGDVSNFATEYFAMYAVACMLFVLTFILTIIGAIIRKRFREVYQ